MGLFGKDPKPANTITNEQMRDLSRRAAQQAPDWFSQEATQQRLASNAQQARADQS